MQEIKMFLSVFAALVIIDDDSCNSIV